MATCMNTKREPVEIQSDLFGRSGRVRRRVSLKLHLIERDKENPNLALVQFGRNEQQWVLLNVNLKGA